MGWLYYGTQELVFFLMLGLNNEQKCEINGGCLWWAWIGGLEGCWEWGGVVVLWCGQQETHLGGTHMLMMWAGLGRSAEDGGGARRVGEVGGLGTHWAGVEWKECRWRGCGHTHRLLSEYIQKDYHKLVSKLLICIINLYYLQMTRSFAKKTFNLIWSQWRGVRRCCINNGCSHKHLKSHNFGKNISLCIATIFSQNHLRVMKHSI